MKKIVHIAPTLPPAVDGLGDFCRILADNLERQGFKDNLFMIRRMKDGPIERGIQSFTPRDFYKTLEHHTVEVVILHYVGYAYDNDGLPFYIVNGLRRFKRKTDCRVLIFFHELYSSSDSPFDRAFYTNKLQKRIVKGLGYMADAVFTSCDVYRGLLRGLLTDHRIEPVCTGIFSNIPDDLYDRHIQKDEDSIVVFGSLQKRNEVYHQPKFNVLINRLGVSTVYDVGPGLSDCHLADANVFIEGALPPRELASRLNRSRFGALSYPPDLLGKSGIFSAYAAFAVFPFNLTVIDRPLKDGLVEGKTYFNCNTELIGRVFNDEAAEELLKWYHKHDQRKVAETFKEYLS